MVCLGVLEIDQPGVLEKKGEVVSHTLPVSL